MGLSPQPQVSDEERERGLRSLVFEAAFANAAGAVTSGVILTAFALHLGASNSVVGLLAAMPFIFQLLQAPAILLIERTRARKRWAVPQYAGRPDPRRRLTGEAAAGAAPRPGGRAFR